MSDGSASTTFAAHCIAFAMYRLCETPLYSTVLFRLRHVRVDASKSRENDEHADNARFAA